MHDDLLDAVRWAVKEGIAEPKRVAIFGGSYGGYAALVGATFTPDVFCCAVSIVGPSNLVTLLKSIPPYWEPLRKMFAVRVGDPGHFFGDPDQGAPSLGEWMSSGLSAGEVVSIVGSLAPSREVIR